MKKLRIQYNSPVVLTFALVSLGALVLDVLSGGWTTRALFCVYRAPSPTLSPGCGWWAMCWATAATPTTWAT